MAQSQTTKLYSPRLLALSASLADYPLDTSFSRQAEARSRTCGSTIAIGIDIDADGGITRTGMQVSACAVGQSSAAVLAGGAQGRTAGDIREIVERIGAWLEGSAPLPEWPGFEALEPAQPHTGRHGALLLPWKAALEALNSGDTSS